MIRLKANEPQPDQIKRVVVRGTNWVGDAVMTVPALRQLRRVVPDAHITLVSRPGAADIYIDADFVNEVVVYERAGLGSAWNQASEWRRRRFDLALLFQNAFEAAAIAFLARVPLRIGYDADRRGWLLTQAIPLPAWKNERHEIFYYLNLVAELKRLLYGTSEVESVESVESKEPQFALSVSADRQHHAREFLREHGLRPGAPLVLLCPGSINSRAKRWPAERYAAVADRFAATGANVALIGSPGEMEVSEEVSRRARNTPVVLTGQTSVAEATAIISVADVLITNDTGPAHIGSAVGTPTLVIFGPTNPLTTRPFAPNAEIIRQKPDCAPCMLRDCPIDHRCMTAITPEEVFARAGAMMSRCRVEVTA
ncbi:MAG TPA: lipopolysaccharide heptosyltransferase II [Pyrinomonadaceae bacterium]|nr:lipopolysaccharide heptosyltransferase II [Pyrinomonadaceae bacterium]